MTVLAVAIACVIPNASAQNATGRIIGNITDPSGAAILDAKVTVTNVATQVSRETSTDADGYFQVLDLPIGAYRVTIEKEGFRTGVFEDQKLQINQSLRVSTKLTLGQK